MVDKNKNAYILAISAGGAFVLLLLILALLNDRPAPQQAPPVPKAGPPPVAAPPRPPPTKAELAKAKGAQEKAQAEALLRPAMCSRIESNLLGQGYDVNVILLSDNNRGMVILGPGVSRLMARQFAASGIGPRLKKIGFVKVIFMRDQYDWVGEYDVFYNTIRVSGD